MAARPPWGLVTPSASSGSLRRGSGEQLTMTSREVRRRACGQHRRAVRAGHSLVIRGQIPHLGLRSRSVKTRLLHRSSAGTSIVVGVLKVKTGDPVRTDSTSNCRINGMLTRSPCRRTVLRKSKEQFGNAVALENSVEAHLDSRRRVPWPTNPTISFRGIWATKPSRFQDARLPSTRAELTASVMSGTACCPNGLQVGARSSRTSAC